MLPKKVGQYRVIAQLGQGGMARALLALHQGEGGFQKLFVVKQLRVDLCDDPEYIEMFLDEARLAALLNHPNVVQTHEIGEDTDSYYILMEFLEGQSFGRIQQKFLSTQGRRFPLSHSVHVISEVLLGLHYAHELADLHGNALSLVHRDISPDNIFITYDGQVKLLDFGIAKVNDRGNTKVGILKGKLSYMAPEQAMNHSLDCRTDVFAMGVLLWEAIAGRQLVPRNEPEQVTFHHRVQGSWKSIHSVSPDAPSTLLKICDKAMALDPDERFQNAKGMRVALLDYLRNREESQCAESLGQLVGGTFKTERETVTKAITDTIASEQRFATNVGESSDAPTESIGNIATALTTIRELPDLSSLLVAISDTDESEVDSPTVSLHASGSQPAIETEPKKRRYWPVAVLAVAAITAYIALTRSSNQRPDAADTTLATSPNTRLDPSNISPNDFLRTDMIPEVRFVVRVSPASATIKLDGEVLTNPFLGKRHRTAKAHQLLVSADGFETESITIHFQEDKEWDITLAQSSSTNDTNNSVQKERRRNFRNRKRQTRVKNPPIARKRKLAVRERVQLVNIKARTKDQLTKRPRMGDMLSTSPKNPQSIDRDNPYD